MNQSSKKLKMHVTSNPYESPAETIEHRSRYAEIPISKKYYAGLFVAILGGSAFFAFGFREIGVDNWISVLFVVLLSSFLVFSLWHTSRYLTSKDQYSLIIDDLGVLERFPSKNRRIRWCDIESISLRSVDSSKAYVTYRLKKRTSMRFSTFGRFDAMHFSQYQISQEALLEIVCKYHSLYLSQTSESQEKTSLED